MPYHHVMKIIFAPLKPGRVLPCLAFAGSEHAGSASRKAWHADGIELHLDQLPDAGDAQPVVEYRIFGVSGSVPENSI